MNQPCVPPNNVCSALLIGSLNSMSALVKKLFKLPPLNNTGLRKGLEGAGGLVAAVGVNVLAGVVTGAEMGTKLVGVVTVGVVVMAGVVVVVTAGVVVVTVVVVVAAPPFGRTKRTPATAVPVGFPFSSAGIKLLAPPGTRLPSFKAVTTVSTGIWARVKAAREAPVSKLFILIIFVFWFAEFQVQNFLNLNQGRSFL